MTTHGVSYGSTATATTTNIVRLYRSVHAPQLEFKLICLFKYLSAICPRLYSQHSLTHSHADTGTVRGREWRERDWQRRQPKKLKMWDHDRRA